MACGHCQAAREAAGRALSALRKGDGGKAMEATGEALAHVGDKMAEALRIRQMTRRR